MGSLPLLHLWSKERIPALVLQKPSGHLGRRHFPPSPLRPGRKTQEPLGHISEVSSTDQHVNSSCVGCVPSRAPVVCTFWCWQHGLLPTISILIGIFSTTCNYCQEWEQDSDFYFPRALMVLSTCKNSQPCLRLEQSLHGVHLDLSRR